MRQIEWRSLRRGTKLLDELADDRPRVVRAGAGLGMELRRARALARKVEPLDGAVVQRHVRRLALVRPLHGKAVVLRRHEHASGRALQHRMGRATVAERQLVRLHPRRKGEQLVAETDPEHGYAP